MVGRVATNILCTLYAYVLRTFLFFFILSRPPAPIKSSSVEDEDEDIIYIKTEVAAAPEELINSTLRELFPPPPPMFRIGMNNYIGFHASILYAARVQSITQPGGVNCANKNPHGATAHEYI